MRYTRVLREVMMKRWWWIGLLGAACTRVSPINPFQHVDTDTDAVDTDNLDTGDTTPPDTIESVQLGHRGPGETVFFHGVVVTGGSSIEAYVQALGGGQQRGILIDFRGFGPASAPAIGAVVDVRGQVVNDHGVSKVALIGPRGWTDSGAIVAPTPLVVHPSQVVGSPEPYEGVLLMVQDGGTPLTVLDPDLGFGEFSVTSQLRVDDLFYSWTAHHPLLAGDTFESITGILTYSFGTHKLLPRSGQDLVGHVAQTGVLDALQPGDLVVTELMPDPSFCSDSACEWIEISNRSGDEVDLLGLQLEDASGNTGAVTVSVLVPDGGRAVLGRGDGSAWGYGFTPAAFYGSDLSLNNTTDRVVLKNSSQTLSQTPDYTDVVAGASLQLSVGVSAADAATWSSWCVSDHLIAGAGGDRGSPGAANATCP